MSVTTTAAKTKSPRKINRVMIDAKKDSFYGQSYTVIDRVSLNYFDPGANSNKFYIAEIHSNTSGCRFYANYGRVGAKGTENAKPCKSVDEARKVFTTKVRQKMNKGYVKVDLATFSRGSNETKKQVNGSALKGVVDTSKIKASKTKLDTKVQDFITKIYAEANQAVSLSLTGSVKSDIKAPLGNLGINGINWGRKLLNDLSRAVRIDDVNYIRNASIEYYRHIPRKLANNVRDESTWILNTQARISKELDTLDLYEDTLRMLPVMGVSDIDAKYMALHCDIAPVVDPNTMNYINLKIKNTHAGNHNYKLRVTNAFHVKQKNAPQFDGGCGNVVKLFHGSRSANMVGILSSYLKLPNNLGSGVVKTGAMFGPGIYFASQCTKSANYAFGTWSGRANKYKTAYLLICEVAMGEVYKVDSSHYFSKAPQGYHSVMGCKGANLYNNEFIVYDPRQVRMRYIVEVEKY